MRVLCPIVVEIRHIVVEITRRFFEYVCPAKFSMPPECSRASNMIIHVCTYTRCGLVHKTQASRNLFWNLHTKLSRMVYLLN